MAVRKDRKGVWGWTGLGTLPYVYPIHWAPEIYSTVRSLIGC